MAHGWITCQETCCLVSAALIAKNATVSVLSIEIGISATAKATDVAAFTTVATGRREGPASMLGLVTLDLIRIRSSCRDMSARKQ
jgi:hypothetical protein